MKRILRNGLRFATLQMPHTFPRFTRHGFSKSLPALHPRNTFAGFGSPNPPCGCGMEHCRIIDVAYDAGFESVDGFQRAFLREFGCNPREYANSPIPLPLFTPYGVKFSKPGKGSSEMETVTSVFIQVIEKPARKVIIKRGEKATEYWSYCEEVGCDVWGILTSMKSLCGEPVCLRLPEKYRKPGTSEYVQGVEVALDYNGAVPDGFDVIELPAADRAFSGIFFRLGRS